MSFASLYLLLPFLRDEDIDSRSNIESTRGTDHVTSQREEIEDVLFGTCSVIKIRLLAVGICRV